MKREKRNGYNFDQDVEFFNEDLRLILAAIIVIAILMLVVISIIIIHPVHYSGNSDLRIVYDHDVNKSFIMPVLSKINMSELKGVNQLYFSSSDNDNASGLYQYDYKFIDSKKTKVRLVRSTIKMWSNSYRNPEYLRCVLLHEIGHHQQMITQYLNNLSEDYANDYAYAHGCAEGTIYDERLEQPRNLSSWE